MASVKLKESEDSVTFGDPDVIKYWGATTFRLSLVILRKNGWKN